MLRQPVAFFPFFMPVAAPTLRPLCALWEKRRDIFCTLLITTLTQCSPVQKQQQPPSDIIATMGYEAALQRMLTGIRACYGSSIIDHELDAKTKMAIISIYTPQTISPSLNSGFVPVENHTSNILNVKIIDQDGSAKLILSDGSFTALSRLWLAGEKRCTKS